MSTGQGHVRILLIIIPMHRVDIDVAPDAVLVRGRHSRPSHILAPGGTRAVGLVAEVVFVIVAVADISLPAECTDDLAGDRRVECRTITANEPGAAGGCRAPGRGGSTSPGRCVRTKHLIDISRRRARS